MSTFKLCIKYFAFNKILVWKLFQPDAFTQNAAIIHLMSINECAKPEDPNRINGKLDLCLASGLFI